MRYTLYRIALPLLLPKAVNWVRSHETRILSEGIPLGSDGLINAHQVGVSSPRKIRILKVDAIPEPEVGILKMANRHLSFVSSNTAGITFWYGIYIRRDIFDEERTITHECVHVAQYERFGTIRSFLGAYLDECLRFGYPNSPLEIEAINGAARIHA